MDVMWGYVWGIWWWRMTGKNMDPNRLRTGLSAIPSSLANAKDLRNPRIQVLRDRGLARGIPEFVPTDIVVVGSRFGSRNRRIVTHQWNGFVPVGSICKAGGRCYVASPEFCLLQVASGLKRMFSTTLRPWQLTVVLSELVCELCGTYSKQNTTRGFKERGCPLSSVGQIMVFCGRVAFEPGANTLRKALSWSLDGLNSPMETVLFLMLCLPKSYGGLEFPRPISNPTLHIPENLWTKTAKRHIVPDLFWPEVGLFVEFNGEDSHRGREVEDQERQEIAQDMGYVVVTFRKEDLYDYNRFMAKAQSVAKYLDCPLPDSTKRFNQQQILLHNMLLHHARWV